MDPFFLTLFYIFGVCMLGIGAVQLWSFLHKSVARKGNVFLCNFMFIGYPAIVLLGLSAEIYFTVLFLGHH
jgi:hypothetical protein